VTNAVANNEQNSNRGIVHLIAIRLSAHFGQGRSGVKPARPAAVRDLFARTPPDQSEGRVTVTPSRSVSGTGAPGGR